MDKPKKEMLLLAMPPKHAKTFTIKLLYDKLEQFDRSEQDMSKLNYDDLKPEYGSEEFQNIKDKKHGRNKEILEAIKINGVTIGFASISDHWYEIKDNMKFFEERKCDICITACSCMGLSREGNKQEIILDFVKKHRCGISAFDFRCGDDYYCNNERARMMFDRLKYLYVKVRKFLEKAK